MFATTAMPAKFIFEDLVYPSNSNGNRYYFDKGQES